MNQDDPQKEWQNRSIIIAEDEDSNFKYLQILLDPTGITIYRANNGIQVMKLIREHPGVDLILMDIKMPAMDGLEATRQIRAFNTQVPVIALTAYAMTDDRERSLQAGCNDYISKPFSRSRIFSVLGPYLDQGSPG